MVQAAATVGPQDDQVDVLQMPDGSLLISAGGRIGLLGVNGAGKSTLVKAISDGSTLLDGERSLSKDTHIGYFAQHQLELLEPSETPYDHVRAAQADSTESERRNYLGRRQRQ